MKLRNTKGTYEFEGENNERGILLWQMVNIETGAVGLYDPAICSRDGHERRSFGRGKGVRIKKAVPDTLTISGEREEKKITDTTTGQSVVCI